MKYVIKKRNKVYEILDTNSSKGFKFKTKNDDIKSITIENNKMIDKVITNKINDMFTRVLMIVNDAFNSDDNPQGTAVALDEISMIRTQINIKYAKYLSEEKELLYLKKLDLLEEEMKYKYYNYQNYYVENKGKGR